MRLVATVACLSACVPRVETTRVTLFDRTELVSASTAPTGPLGVVDRDVVLLGRPADVLTFDGDRLRMHLVDRQPGCRGRNCELDLRLDTPLGNVRSIHAVSMAVHHVIPLGLVAGTVLTVFGGGMIAYDRTEHLGGSFVPPALAIGFGLAILAIEIRARLADDEVTLVR